VDKEVRSFNKTLKSFNKSYRKIRKNRIVSKSGRRLWRSAAVIFSLALILTFIFPPFRFPVDGEVTSGFFLRRRPESFFALDLEIHKGIDLSSPEGARVVAAAPGRVKATGFGDTYGNYIVLSHLFGFETRYAHLREISVARGDVVVLRSLKAIGTVGSTGRSTAPHLHFEIRWMGLGVPPRFFLLFHGIRKALLGF
jgi:murein DD-endopeptidase MepM/ murein hydrolase activator NlpD